MDYEAELVRYLNNNLSFKWFHDVPAERPAQFGVLRISSQASDDRFRKRSSFIFKCFCDERKKLSAMANELETAIFSVPDDFANIFAAAYVGDYREVDATSGMQTRVITVEFTINE